MTWNANTPDPCDFCHGTGCASCGGCGSRRAMSPLADAIARLGGIIPASRALGCTDEAVRHWVAGRRRPRRQWLERIATLTGTVPEALR